MCPIDYIAYGPKFPHQMQNSPKSAQTQKTVIVTPEYCILHMYVCMCVCMCAHIVSHPSMAALLDLSGLKAPQTTCNLTADQLAQLDMDDEDDEPAKGTPSSRPLVSCVPGYTVNL